MSNHLPTILIIGNCIVDQVSIIKQFPSEDSEFRALDRIQQAGGNACNSAVILSKLGHSVELVAQLADDVEGEWLKRYLLALGIGCGYCALLPGSKTPLSSIWLNRSNGSRTICHYRDLPELSLAHLKQIPLQKHHWLHCEGRNVEVLRQYLPRIRKQAIAVSLEIEKPRSGIEDLLPFVDVAIISSHYLGELQLSAEQCLQRFYRINPHLRIVCTLGERGLLASDAGAEPVQIEAEVVSQVVDSVGAGDCFIAGLIHQLSQQFPFVQALTFANRLAASKVQQQGMNFEIGDL